MVDLEGCTQINFPAAYWIISSLKHLQMIIVDPGNKSIEFMEWKKLHNTFLHITFGPCFLAMFTVNDVHALPYSLIEE